MITVSSRIGSGQVLLCVAVCGIAAVLYGCSMTELDRLTLGNPIA